MAKALLDNLTRKGSPAVTVARLAEAVRAAPDHPVSKDLRIWSEDKETFNHFKWDNTPDALEWRRRMDIILRRIQPDITRGGNLFRGMRTSEPLEAIRRDGIFDVTTVGDSFSEDIRVVIGGYLTEGGFLMEVVSPKNARMMNSIFKEIGGKAAAEREAIYPRGSSFVLLKETTKSMEIAGQKVKIPYLIFEEE